MKFILESRDVSDYLKPDEHIDFHDAHIQQKAAELFAPAADEKEKIKRAYEYVRDDISHSIDIRSGIVTRCASEALEHKEGLCLSKSMLLAALLRCGGIPAGLCYQRLMVENGPDAEYVIHGLNAVFISDEKKWVRLDARGNKQSIDARFSTDEERIAFPVRAERGEVDFPVIYARPPPSVIKALNECVSPLEYCFDTQNMTTHPPG